jgi:hypothetical protein
MRHLLGAMRQEAMKAIGERATTRLARITSYDPNNYSAKVSIQPEGHLTGWLPVLATWVGNGWGMFCPPSIGDLVDVHFQEGDINSGMVGMRLFNDGERPLPTPSGEFWLVHQSGAFLKLTNDGKLMVNSQVEIDATAPTISITAAGNVSVTAGAAATVNAPAISLGAVGQTLKSVITDAFISLFNSHTHASSGAGVPNQTMSAGSHATSTVKAG